MENKPFNDMIKDLLSGVKKVNVSDEVPTLEIGLNRIEVPINNYTLCGTIDVEYDGVRAQNPEDEVDGEFTFDIDLELLDHNGDSIDFNVDENYFSVNL